jgi:nucleoside-diphosphate-sugar epimerase
MTEGARILITGGGGLIGGRLARQLVDAGCQVTVLDIAPPAAGSLPYLDVLQHPALTYVQGSVTSAAAWAGLPKDFAHIVHAAAILGIERVPREQIETMDVTVTGTRMALEYARALPGLERFLFLSTSEIYGVSAQGLDERAPAVIQSGGGRWCYASAKLTAEFYVRAYADRYGVPFTIVRPFNVYGPSPTCRGALTEMAGRALRGKTISLSGDGRQTRSWCHVQDFAEGLQRCLFDSACRNETFNLGSDAAELSILDLAQMIRGITQSSSAIVISGSTEPDVLTRRPDLTKAKKMLAFQPRIDLPEGIEDIIAWMKSASPEQRGRPAGRR